VRDPGGLVHPCFCRDRARANIQVSEAAGNTAVVIAASARPTFTTWKLEQPARVVVELSGARLGNVEVPLDAGTYAVGLVSASVTEDDSAGPRTRIVLTLRQTSDYQVEAKGNDITLRVFRAPETAVARLQAEAAPRPRPGHASEAQAKERSGSASPDRGQAKTEAKRKIPKRRPRPSASPSQGRSTGQDRSTSPSQGRSGGQDRSTSQQGRSAGQDRSTSPSQGRSKAKTKHKPKPRPKHRPRPRHKPKPRPKPRPRPKHKPSQGRSTGQDRGASQAKAEAQGQDRSASPGQGRSQAKTEAQAKPRPKHRPRPRRRRKPRPRRRNAPSPRPAPRPKPNWRPRPRRSRTTRRSAAKDRSLAQGRIQGTSCRPGRRRGTFARRSGGEVGSRIGCARNWPTRIEKPPRPGRGERRQPREPAPEDWPSRRPRPGSSKHSPRPSARASAPTLRKAKRRRQSGRETERDKALRLASEEVDTPARRRSTESPRNKKSNKSRLAAAERLVSDANTVRDSESRLAEREEEARRARPTRQPGSRCIEEQQGRGCGCPGRGGTPPQERGHAAEQSRQELARAVASRRQEEARKDEQANCAAPRRASWKRPSPYARPRSSPGRCARRTLPSRRGASKLESERAQLETARKRVARRSQSAQDHAVATAACLRNRKAPGDPSMPRPGPRCGDPH
jgi:hypothetical protein